MIHAEIPSSAGNRHSREPSAFSLISRTYKSDLTFRCKNDCVCKFIAKRYGLVAVSILFFDGETDTLINRGSYIDESSLDYLGDDADFQTKSRHMLRYIGFYDFLYYKFYQSGLPANLSQEDIVQYIKEFKEDSNRYFNYRFDLSLLTDDFVKICHRNSIFLATNGMVTPEGSLKLDLGSFYNRIKRTYKSSETYQIGEYATNYSGKVYGRSLKNNSGSETAHRLIYTAGELSGTGVSDDQQLLHSILKDVCEYQLQAPLNYFGIPLYANNRVLGVLRILAPPGNTSIIDDPETNKSLLNCVEILGEYLDHDYTEEFIDSIDHDWEDYNMGDVSRSEIIKPNAYCNGTRRALDCFGTSLYMRSSPGGSPSMIGISTDPAPFIKLHSTVFAKNGDPFIAGTDYHPLLHKLFPGSQPPKNSLIDEAYRLVGIAITIDSMQKQFFSVKYYYCHKGYNRNGESERVRETTEAFLFKGKKHPDLGQIFNRRLLESLYSPDAAGQRVAGLTNIRHILLVDIPSIHVSGMTVFFNTENRCFNLRDVRFAYGEMKRLGLEIQKVVKERIKNYSEISNSYIHDIKSLIAMAIMTNIMEPGPLAGGRHGKLHQDLLTYIASKISSFQKLATYSSQPNRAAPPAAPWNFVRTFEEHCKRISEIGSFYKDTKVWFQVSPGVDPMTKLEKGVFELCFFTLLENAMKYSYGKQSKTKLPEYRREDERTVGHVHVRLYEDKDSYIIDIANWGCPIPDPDKIFDQGIAPDSVMHFLENENIPITYQGNPILLWRSSERIGLYALRQFIREIDGECALISKDDAIIFTLKVKKDGKKRDTKKRAS